MPPESWRPILDGDARQAALATVRAIADALRRPYQTWPLSRHGDRHGVRSASLASGRAGVALFYGYLARARRDRAIAAVLDPGQAPSDDDALALRFLNEAIDHAAQAGMNASLYCGFAGVGWVAHHLSRDWGDSDQGADAVDDVDAIVVESVTGEGHTAPCDLIDGLVGLGVYALERLPRPDARRALAAVIECLEARAVETVAAPPADVVVGTPPTSEVGVATGLAWASGVAAGDEAAPYFNLGLSHGVPGVIALLARMHRTGLDRERTGRLLHGAVSWLLGCQLPPGSGSVFPDYVDRDGPRTRARTAWCYGDPGVACALLAAGRAVGVPAWERAALDIARTAAARPFADTQVVDAGLCHGAAGLGLIFHRLYLATGDRACGDAARAWFGHCLAMREPPACEPAADDSPLTRDEVAIAGLLTWSMERVATGERVADPCWLTGAAGIGLALLSAATSVPPEWHRLLLVDISR